MRSFVGCMQTACSLSKPRRRLATFYPVRPRATHSPPPRPSENSVIHYRSCSTRCIIYDDGADKQTAQKRTPVHLNRLDTRAYHAFAELRTSASHVHSSSNAPSNAPRLLHAIIGLFSCPWGSKCKTSLTVVSPTNVPKSSTRITRGLRPVRILPLGDEKNVSHIPHAFKQLHHNLKGQCGGDCKRRLTIRSVRRDFARAGAAAYLVDPRPKL